VPQKLVVASDGIVIRDRYYYTFFHNVHFNRSLDFARDDRKPTQLQLRQYADVDHTQRAQSLRT
jgi:hypothetical protein